MDYEKMYNEALERARELHGTVFVAAQDLTEQIFPELRESEGERIIKALETFINQPEIADKITFEARIGWLNWLEKQKEQNECPEFCSGHCVGCEQKEQKPTESTALQKAFISSKIDYTLEEKCDASDYAEAILPTSVVYGENEEEYKLHKIIEAAFIAGQKKEQNPTEWSDTNELVFKDICKHLKEEGYNGWIVLLEALRNGEFQPKQKWSEEDERAINCACVALRAYAHGDLPEFLPSELMGYADRLQSLRLDSYKNCNSRWKPSEDQMEADFEQAAKHVYESWMGGTMDHFRRDMNELGRVLNSR